MLHHSIYDVKMLWVFFFDSENARSADTLNPSQWVTKKVMRYESNTVFGHTRN